MTLTKQPPMNRGYSVLNAPPGSESVAFHHGHKVPCSKASAARVFLLDMGTACRLSPVRKGTDRLISVKR